MEGCTCTTLEVPSIRLSLEEEALQIWEESTCNSKRFFQQQTYSYIL